MPLKWPTSDAPGLAEGDLRQSRKWRRRDPARQDLGRERAGVKVTGRLAAGDHHSHRWTAISSGGRTARGRAARCTPRLCDRAADGDFCPATRMTARERNLQARRRRGSRELFFGVDRALPVGVGRAIPLTHDERARGIQHHRQRRHGRASCTCESRASPVRRPRTSGMRVAVIFVIERVPVNSPIGVALHAVAHLVGYARRRFACPARVIDPEFAVLEDLRERSRRRLASVRNDPGYLIDVTVSTSTGALARRRSPSSSPLPSASSMERSFSAPPLARTASAMRSCAEAARGVCAGAAPDVWSVTGRSSARDATDRAGPRGRPAGPAWRRKSAVARSRSARGTRSYCLKADAWQLLREHRRVPDQDDGRACPGAGKCARHAGCRPS